MTANKCYDKNGTEIHEFDLLKIFHFIGARRKKYFMYKWVRLNEGYLYAMHIEDNTNYGYFLNIKPETHYPETEIIQSPFQLSHP